MEINKDWIPVKSSWLRDDTSPLYSLFYKIEPDLKPRLKAQHHNLWRIRTFRLPVKTFI